MKQYRLNRLFNGGSKHCLNVANVYGKELPAHLFSRMIENPVKQALELLHK